MFPILLHFPGLKIKKNELIRVKLWSIDRLVAIVAEKCWSVIISYSEPMYASCYIWCKCILSVSDCYGTGQKFANSMRTFYFRQVNVELQPLRNPSKNSYSTNWLIGFYPNSEEIFNHWTLDISSLVIYSHWRRFNLTTSLNSLTSRRFHTDILKSPGKQEQEKWNKVCLIKCRKNQRNAHHYIGRWACSTALINEASKVYSRLDNRSGFFAET